MFSYLMHSQNGTSVLTIKYGRNHIHMKEILENYWMKLGLDEVSGIPEKKTVQLDIEEEEKENI